MSGRGRGRPPHPDVLTPAEQRVLEELRRGGTNVEIAVRLGLSPETVKTHIASMLAKLALDDRHTLAAWRAERERRRVLGLLAVPPALASLGRPLLWAGTAFGGMAIVAVVVVLLVTLLGYEEEERMVLPHTLTATATGATTQFEALPAPELTLVSRGEHDALKLEWTGGPTNVTTWQYRQRSWQDGQPLEWELHTKVDGRGKRRGWSDRKKVVGENGIHSGEGGGVVYRGRLRSDWSGVKPWLAGSNPALPA